MPLPDPCSVPIVDLNPVCVGTGAVAAAAQSISFVTDPLGYIAQKCQEGAAGLAGSVLPALERITHPDLTSAWFVSAYQISFALAIFMWVGMLGWNFVQLARRRVSGTEVAETLGYYTPAFFAGAMFGPALGTMFVALTGAISDSLITWGIGGSSANTITALQTAITAADPNKILGGSIVAIIFFVALIIALVLALVVLLVMLVTLYLTGAVLPMSLAWLNNPRQRGRGLKVMMVWFGILFSHVLLFLMLGVAFSMISGMATNFGDPALQVLANLAVAVIALFMATLSPLALVKFAPVGPTSASGGGPSWNIPSQRSAGSSSYPVSDGDSQTGQMARDDSSHSSDGESGTEAGTAGEDSSAAESGSTSSGGLSALLADEDAPSGSSPTTGGDGTDAPAGATASGTGSSSLHSTGPDASVGEATSSGATAGAAAAPAGSSAGSASAGSSGSPPSGSGSSTIGVGELAGSAAGAMSGGTASGVGAGAGGTRAFAGAEAGDASAGTDSVGSVEPAGAAGGVTGRDAGGAGPVAAGASGVGQAGAATFDAVPASASVGGVPADGHAEASTAELTTAGASAGDATPVLAKAGTGAQDTGERITAAGRAADATGVGAAIGAVMEVVGDSLQAAGKVVTKTAHLAQDAGGMAAEHLEHGERTNH